MKKVIPVIIAIALIIIVVGVSFGQKIFDKYSYGQERADLYEYFDIYNQNQVPMVLNKAKAEASATKIDGVLYFASDVVEEYFSTRFYLDTNENLLLYTTATHTVSTEVGGTSYVENDEVIDNNYVLSLIKDDTLYIALDYLKRFVNYSYEIYEEPLRIVVSTEWERKTVATINKDTSVRWRGGVKSEILSDVKEGDKVTILEPMDDWTKVMTFDGLIGYVENKRLSDEEYEDEVAVTEVPTEEFTYLTRDYKINMTWHNMEYPQDGTDLKNAVKNARALNVISPTWFWLNDNEGNIKSVANENYVTTAHNLGMEVWASVANFHYGVDADTYEVLAYTSRRKVLVDNLVSKAVQYGADGINVDFENMNSATTPHFVQFIRELTLECHKNNLVVSVDNYVPTEYTAHYNRREQAKFADYIVIMGYDEYYKGSPEAGSVSSIPWMQKGIEDTVAIVGKEKVINAVPFYTRVWKTKDGTVTSEAVEMQVSKDFISNNNIETKWDESTYQNYGEKEMGGTLYQVWLEDTDSLAVRLNIMQTLEIAGIASWCLGQETPDMWVLIEGYMAK